MNELVAALLFRKLGGKGGFPEPTGSIDITKNGITDVKNYAEANVNVPNTYAASDVGKVVDNNGTLVSQTSKSVTENGTFDTTKNNSVVVNVPNPSSGSLEISQNGTYDVTNKASAVVNVPSGELKEYTSSEISKGTFKDWTTSFNAGNTLTVALAPTDGTTVEVGDEVLVHGEITSSAGGFAYYVTGVVTSIDSLSKPVITVKGLGQPSPIADGLMIIASNGSSDVREYSSVSVNVHGIGTAFVTENGTHDIDGYRYVKVNVESGGGDVKILFATDATYQDQPVQGNSCSAEVLSVELSSYSEGDKVVLYGVEPNNTAKNYLVVGTITSFNYPSAVYFDVDEVSEISSGGGGKDGFVVLNNVTSKSTPEVGGEPVSISPESTSDIKGVNIGDSLLARGYFAEEPYVLFGKVTEKYDEYVMVSVEKAQASGIDGSTWVLDCSADGELIDGEYMTVILADSSSAAGLNQNDGLIGRLTANGVDYAFYGQVDSVVDQEKGEVQVICLAHMEIPFA